MQATCLAAMLVLGTLGQTPVRTADELRSALRSAGPGTEIVLADGVYAGQFELRTGGGPGRPVVIRAEHVWQAWLDPAGGYGDGLDLGVGTSDVIVDGLRITGARTIGIRASNVRRVTIRNCRVECCANQGILVYGENCSVEYCLLQRNGLTGQHHGLYISGSRHCVQGNVIRDNAGYGLHGYPRLADSIVAANRISGHAVKSGLLIWEGGGNFVLYNAVWNNRVNVDLRQPDATNRVMGNVERDNGEWPLATRPE